MLLISGDAFYRLLRSSNYSYREQSANEGRQGKSFETIPG